VNISFLIEQLAMKKGNSVENVPAPKKEKLPELKLDEKKDARNSSANMKSNRKTEREGTTARTNRERAPVIKCMHCMFVCRGLTN
jgi:hypothetical protein